MINNNPPAPLGPNGFHFEDGVMKPGLGPDEPSEKERLAAASAAEKYRLEQESLKNAQDAVVQAEQELQRRAEEQARLAEERTVEFERRMKELDDREAALVARGQ